jgi:hypothetical protein
VASSDAADKSATTSSPANVNTNGNGSARLSAADAATTGMKDIVALTGKQPEGVTAVEPTSNGWIIAVEVVEDRHVPSSADILAIYQAELGADGTLLAYHRTTRYPRGRGDGGRMRS